MGKLSLPLHISTTAHVKDTSKRLWNKALTALKAVIDAYNVTGLEQLSNDELQLLLNNPKSLLYDKITGSGHTHLSTEGGGKVAVDKEQAMNILKKPEGYENLLAAVSAYVEQGSKFYSDTHGRIGFSVKEIGKYFVLNEAATPELSPEILNEIEEAGKFYITTEKGRDIYTFTQDIGKAFFANNMNQHFPHGMSMEMFSELLDHVIREIDYDTKEVLPLLSMNSGYYGDQGN